MNDEKKHNRPQTLAWMLVVVSTALLVSFTLGAATYRHISQGGEKLPMFVKTGVGWLAAFPGLLKQAAREVKNEIEGRPIALLISKDNPDTKHFQHQFPAASDAGYLLLSALSTGDHSSTIRLIRLADGEVLAKWVPDWSHIHENTSHHRWGIKGNQAALRATHPLLLRDGSLIFNIGRGLVRQPLCNPKPSWVLNYPHHHSVELSNNGNSIWVPSVTEQFAVNNKALAAKLRDDSLAEVSLDGKVIRNLSFSAILANNNLTGHLLGSTGLLQNDDPIHINQITPAPNDGSFWKKDDLLISARHLSTVYLYRPSTGKIIWYQQGPWLNQHSARFFKKNAITVFGNDVYGAPLKHPFVYASQHNQAYLHNFETGNTTSLHADALAELKPITATEGRLQVLDDSSLFIEETNNGRLFKIDATGKLEWAYVNTYDEEYVGALGWSRYLTKQELEKTVSLEQLRCPSSK